MEKVEHEEVASSFSAKDWEILSLVVQLVPDLRRVALLMKEIRKRGQRPPVESPEELLSLIPECPPEIDGLRPSRDDIILLSRELFPLEDELQIAQALYLALVRCKEAMSWAAKAPPNREKLLRRFEYISMVSKQTKQEAAEIFQGGIRDGDKIHD